MSKIFLVTDQKTLVPLEPTEFQTEEMLQALLEDHPDLLDGDPIDPCSPRRWMLIHREFAVPDEKGTAERWSLDHLFLDQEGIPTLVEVKRSTDTRIRREVVGQMLDYAANGVHGWGSLRAAFEKICGEEGVNPERKVQDLIGPEADISQFWQGVDDNLRAGRIRLLFVADEIPEELERVIVFLNNQMDPAVVLGIEIRNFSSGSFQTLVPHVVGRTPEATDRKNASARSTRKWDEPSFVAALRSNQGDSAVGTALQLLRWAEKNGCWIWWGEGAIKANFIPTLDHNGQQHCPFDCFTRPSGAGVYIHFDYFKRKPPFNDEARRRELLDRFNAIPGVQFPAAENFPQIPLAVLGNPSALPQFLEVMEWYIGEVRRSA
jgi:hypothetical protein